MPEKYRNKYRIEPNRAQFWNYSEPASYFISVCTKNRAYILGRIKTGIMVYSRYGQIAANELQKIPEYHKRIILDEWIVMPNHIHCIITLGQYDFDNGVSLIGDNNNDDDTVYRKQRRKMLIPKILGKYKQQTSKQINILRNTPGFNNWQKDYYDHIIRDHKSYDRIRNYIINNPIRWKEDTFYGCGRENS